MELQDYNYEILSKDPSSKEVKFRFTLKEIPNKIWTKTFNRLESDYEFYNIEESKAIIVILNGYDSTKTEYFTQLLSNIKKADEEIQSNTLKQAIYQKILKPGAIACHDSLNYQTEDGSKSELENYLTTLVKNQTL